MKSTAPQRAIVPVRAQPKPLVPAITAGAAAMRYALARARLSSLGYSERDARRRAAFAIFIGEIPGLVAHWTGITPRERMRAQKRFKYAVDAAPCLRQLADAGFGQMLWLDRKTKVRPVFAFRMGTPVNAHDIATGAIKKGNFVDKAPQIGS